MIHLTLIVAAFLLETLAAFGVGGKINLVAGGFACYFLSLLLH